MTLKHVLKHFSKTEVQEDEKLVIQRVKPEESQNLEIFRCAQDDGAPYPLPLRERTLPNKRLSIVYERKLLCERSELSNSGEEYISCAEHTVKVFSPFTSHFSQLCLPSPDATRHPLPGEGKNVSCAEHTEKNLFTYLPIHLFTFKKAAFTLAEVLITLTIIGVVAALTLPTLIQNHQKRVLKSQFLKEYSMLQQSFLKIKQEFGTDDMYKYCTINQGLGYVNKEECFAAVDKILKPVGSCVYNPRVLTYTKDKQAYIDIGASSNPSIRFSDGSCFERTINSQTFGFTIDVNGDKKGPNALGHDIFVFWVRNGDFLKPVKMTDYYDEDMLNDKIGVKCEGFSGLSLAYCSSGSQQFGHPCSRNSSQMGNGLGCSWYALNDICPDDETKGYWDCLP